MNAELATHYKNAGASVEEFLDNGSQFQSALRILGNDAYYNRLIK